MILLTFWGICELWRTPLEDHRVPRNHHVARDRRQPLMTRPAPSGRRGTTLAAEHALRRSSRVRFAPESFGSDQWVRCSCDHWNAMGAVTNYTCHMPQDSIGHTRHLHRKPQAEDAKSNVEWHT